MNILEKIVISKIDYIKDQKRKICEKDMMKAAIDSISIPSFKIAVKKKGLSIIGEIKKASPSKGIIDKDFKYLEIAKEYNKCVDAISVLTETEYFMGSPDYLKQIARQADIPVLRKDFIIDSYQIFESKVLGASCILLITAILDSGKLKVFIELATALGLDYLIEVHDETEVYRALRAGADIIGINNRDLGDFSIDIGRTGKLRALIPHDVLVIGESGIKSPEDSRIMMESGVDAILVGEYFMRNKDKKSLAEALRHA